MKKTGKGKFDPFAGMVKIPAGSFMMGYNDPEGHGGYYDAPLHQVTISHDFWIGKYPVTNRFYQSVMQEEEVQKDELDLPYLGCAYSLADKLNELSEGKLPEGYVFRLPTEAEWEYACRGGTKRTGIYFFDCPEGADPQEELEKYAWPFSGLHYNIHPVGQKLPNGFGLYDMLGNVWEPCCDTEGDTFQDSETDPVHVIRNEYKIIRGRDCAFRCNMRLAIYVGIGIRLVIAPDIDLSPKKTQEQQKAEELQKETRKRLQEFYPGRDIDELFSEPRFCNEEKARAGFADIIIREKYPFEKALYCKENSPDLCSIDCCVFDLELAKQAAERWDKELKQIVYIPLTPMGDVICCINQLEHLKKIYEPCRITVLAIPLIAQLLEGFKWRWVDRIITIKGDIHGNIDLTGFVPPDTDFDVLINMSYNPDSLKLQDMLKCKMRYGSECQSITKEMCEKHFDKWVTLDYWNNVTLKKYRTVCEQMAEPIRLIDPDFNYVYPDFKGQFNKSTYVNGLPEKYVLFFPGTSAITKYWPVSKFLAVAKTLKDAGIDSVFAIGPQDRSVVPALKQSGYPVLDTLKFSELNHVIEFSKLIIGNDSGPMHFAASFHHKPTIHIFAGAAVFNWYPYEKPLHTAITPECGKNEELCEACTGTKSCIGMVSVKQVTKAVFRKLKLKQPDVRKIAFFMQDRIGDSLININVIEEACKFYAPCEITIFASKGMLPFFRNYAFADHVIEYKGKKTRIYKTHYDVIFNYRYDAESVELLRRIPHDKACGYENVDIPENVCKEVYNGGYLPLTMWDDVKLRRFTSVTEQGSALFRLVEPEYHCQYPELSVNTFCAEDCYGQPPIAKGSVFFITGGSYRQKHWPIESYLKLAGEMAKLHRTPFFLFGPDEEDYIPAIKKAGWKYGVSIPFAFIAGMVASSGEDTLAIGNDTGIMHFFKMFNVKSVTISADCAHLTWHPDDTDRRLVLHPACSGYPACTKCEKQNCMELLPYRNVVRKIMKFFNLAESGKDEKQK